MSIYRARLRNTSNALSPRVSSATVSVLSDLRAVFVRFSLGGGGGSEFRLAMTDRATIAGMEVAKLVPWNSLLNKITSVSIEA